MLEHPLAQHKNKQGQRYLGIELPFFKESIAESQGNPCGRDCHYSF
jgi:hypothetical protein